MPGPASIANGVANNGLGPTTPWNARYGGGPTLSASQPPGVRSDLASVLAGAQKPWPMAGYGQGLEMNPYRDNGWRPPDTGGQPWYGPGSPWGMARPGTDVGMVSTGQIYYGPGSPWGEKPPERGPFTGYNFGGGQPGGVTAGPIQPGGGMIPISKSPYGGGGKPAIGYGGGGGGKPRIGYGGGITQQPDNGLRML